MSQYVNDRPLTLGSVDIRVAKYGDNNATWETAASIGMLDGVTAGMSGTRKVEETDNSDDVLLGIQDKQYTINIEAWKNICLNMLYLVSGEAGTYTVTAESTATAVTNEPVTLSGTKPSVLKNKTAASTPTAVSTIVVKSADGATTYVLDTDYTVSTNVGGYTTITRITTGAITDNSTVSVSYGYLKALTEELTVGTDTPDYLHVWLINTDEEGNKFVVEVYKVEGLDSAEIKFGSDKKKDLVRMPLTLVGKPDSTRTGKNNIFRYWIEYAQSA